MSPPIISCSSYSSNLLTSYFSVVSFAKAAIPCISSSSIIFILVSSVHALKSNVERNKAKRPFPTQYPAFLILSSHKTKKSPVKIQTGELKFYLNIKYSTTAKIIVPLVINVLISLSLIFSTSLLTFINTLINLLSIKYLNITMNLIRFPLNFFLNSQSFLTLRNKKPSVSNTEDPNNYKIKRYFHATIHYYSTSINYVHFYTNIIN